MNWQLDHFVRVVTDLDAGIAFYRAQGFTVAPGGRHLNVGVANALIALGDGCYVELFCFVEPDKAPRSHSSWPIHARGGGFGSFWFFVTDVDAEVARVRAAGVALEDPRAGGRLRPDGYEIKWRLAVPAADHLHVPALIEDVTPRAERAPPFSGHANGAERVAAFSLAVPDLARVRDFYSRLGVPAAKMSETSVDTLVVHLDAAQLNFSKIAASSDQPGLQAVELATTSGSRMRFPAF